MKQKVSLVLSGGGARGIAHIGVIEELEKQGFDIFSVVGTSMGALVGGIYALEKIEEFKEWICTLDKLKVFSLVDFSFSKQGLVKGDKLLKKLQEFISDQNIEDLSIYYAAIASDIINQKEVVFKSGSVYNAIRASIAIPTVFTPVKAENGLLVDGGIINNLPINHAKRIKGDLLVAVNVNADIPVDKPLLSKKESDKQESIYQKKIKEFSSHLLKIIPLTSDDNEETQLGFFELINKTISMVTNYNAQMALTNHQPDILINISHESCGTYDFYKAEEMVEIGRHAAIKALEKFKSNS